MTQAAVEALLASDDEDRTRLAAAESLAHELRERLRGAEDRSRAAESADLQARLELDLVREQVLVELAGLGDVGLRALVPDLIEATDDGGVGVGVFSADEIGEAEATAEGVRFEAALDTAIERWSASPPAGQAPSSTRLAALRRRYHELGAANPYAATEYAEVRDRLESMEAQERDLREAIASTRALIAELSTLVSEQFRTTFRALEGAFDTRFRQLFGGGYAKLSLTDPDDLTATGVEIVARPPGKKAQALAMLSGGERALTAVALLFAMLEVRPVPFCVLDEVDAALDEANIGRFTDALRSLTDTTQFIVITHNRGTIEAADALYGITVGEDSASRVISLRVDEASALAARGRAEPQAEELAAVG
jgi:chromosome segregation protein